MIDIFDINNYPEDPEGKKKEPKEPPRQREPDPRHIGLDREIEIKRLELERLTNIYENIKKSERLRAKINKAFIAGAPLEEILRDCLEVISLMTGDTVFYKQNIKKLSEIIEGRLS